MNINHYSDEFLAKFPGRATSLTSIQQFELLENPVPAFKSEKLFVEFSASKIATGTPHEAHWTKNSLKLELLTVASCVSKDVPSQCPHFDFAITISPLGA
jgi:hypothetical protein